MAFANKNKPSYTFKNLLPNKKDYQSHSTEVILPPLESGSYLLLLTTAKDSLSDKSAFAYTIMTATKLAVSYSKSKKHLNFQVVHRKTGAPIEDALVNCDSILAKTDKNGYATFNYPPTEKNGKLILIHENDTLTEQFYNYRYRREAEEKNFKAKAQLFTDRSIYRPGQNVFFKGIVIQEKNGNKSVVPNVHVKVIAENFSGEEIYNKRLKTNEYGSFEGEFTLSKQLLTGDFKITTAEDDVYEYDEIYNKKEKTHPFWDEIDQFIPTSIYLSVEEYKRPKFEIVFEPIKENFIVGQKIKIKGKAKSLAGSNISDAKVRYSVTKSSYHDSYRNYDYESDDENESVKNKNLITDADGNFEIEFASDTSKTAYDVDRTHFNYTVDVEIIDVNGETKKNTIDVKVGYHSLILATKMNKAFDISSSQAIAVVSTNLNNQFTPAIVEVKIYKSKAPLRVLGERAWKFPEIQTISEREFIKFFPGEPYTEENAVDTWEKETLVFSKTIDTQKDKEIIIDNFKNWKTGQYQVIFSAKDAYGKKIESADSFRLFDKTDSSIDDKQLFHVDVLNKNPQKDGFIMLKLAAGAKFSVNLETFYKSTSFFIKTIDLDTDGKIVRIPIDKSWKEEVNFNVNFVWENQYFAINQAVAAPQTKENLSIELNSIRNKIEPGSPENWSFTVLNNNKKAIRAEALATMYDASLDYFTSNDWNLNFGFPKNDYYEDTKDFLGFGTATREFKNFHKSSFGYSPPIQPKNALNWFGFDFIYPERNSLLYKKYLTDKVAQLSGKIITGIVYDQSGPLPGASVMISGTQRGTQTDFDGKYEIKALYNEILVYSFVGYNDSYVRVSDNNIDVLLEEGVQIGEVIFEGAIGIKRKTNAITSSNTVVAEERTEFDSSLQVLKGRVSGLQINTAPNNENYITLTGMDASSSNHKALIIIDGKIESFKAFSKIDPLSVVTLEVLQKEQGVALYGSQGANGAIIITTKASLEELSNVKTRKNFNETAFFLPQLQTNAKGNLKFSFTSPEALTQWKLRILAHNKKAVSGYLESTIITQKDLMVLPNMPRFLREKDSIVITSKISNLTVEAKSGIAMLQLFDATTMEAIDAKMENTSNIKNFNIKAKGNTAVSWKIYIPEGLQGVQYKIVAKSGNFSDGEENILPVLTNNMLVTESIPIWVRENAKKDFTFENLENYTSTTLRNQQLTLEYTSNPTWLAIQSLPYLMEYEHECTEQTFARYYANALASEIINSNPKIAEVFETWRKSDKPVSKLQQNEELKSIVLAETPWLADAQSEEEKKKNMALLFDLDKMKDSQKAVWEKLVQMQKPSGGFAWFDNGEESEYITRHIISGLGHLRKLTHKKTDDLDQTSKKGIDFLDQKFLDNYILNEAKENQTKLIWKNPYQNLHYLYTRSLYFDCYPMGKNLERVTELYGKEIAKNWPQYSLYEKAMASLVLSRFGDQENAKKILESLRQTASNNEEWGMYWIENKSGWYWYNAPIETQALLIEAFAEVDNDKIAVEAMKVWLLKSKQNKNWPTTKSTTEAVYALLMQGTNWISVKDKTTFKIGDEKTVLKKLSENEKEAGTGYIKLNWKGDEITKDMATLSIKNNSEVPSFGGFYWQYFEDLDKIKSSQLNPMSIEKELYLKENTSKGKQLQRITTQKPLKIGDLVTVRLIVSTKEDMEFVHLKDMRASCFEPIDVISGYKWQDRLGYYQSTKDVATHFFFDKIYKGKFVLEYDIRVNNLGDFSNGITTIQSMYAPEFSNHTKGIRVQIKE